MLFDSLLRLPGIQVWGYLFAFAAAFLETLPGIGLVVPGQTIVVAAGFLSQQGYLSLPVVILLAIIGAFLGDLLGYWLGRRYGINFIKKRKGVVREVVALLAEHPAKTLIIGRFNSVTRAFAPFAAGMCGVPPRIFLTANLIGGVMWGLCWTLVGYIVGASYSVASKWIDAAILVIVFSATLGYLAYRYAKRRQSSARVPILIGMLVASLGVFLWAWRSVHVHGLFTRLDVIAYSTAINMQSNWLTNVMLVFTTLGSMPVVIALTVLVCVLVWRKNKKETIAIASAMIIGAFLAFIVKELVGRARPHSALLFIDSSSFPSGHTVRAATLGLIVALIVYRRGHRAWTLPITLCVAATLVGLSRIYLRVHYASDVIAGALLGVVVACGAALWLEMYEQRSKLRSGKTLRSR